jgi:hypothetical protein
MVHLEVAVELIQILDDLVVVLYFNFDRGWTIVVYNWKTSEEVHVSSVLAF